MFAVSEEDAAAIKAAFEHGGEFSAAIELRRRFPLINDNDQALEHARIIAGWQPIRAIPQSRKAAKSESGKHPDAALYCSATPVRL